MTASTPQTTGPGAPFAAMARGAMLPTIVVGILTVGVVTIVRGTDAFAGAALGFVVPVIFFASGFGLMSRLVRSASPGAFAAVALAVYLGQVLLLLLFLMLFLDADWIDGTALGIVALVVTVVWQGFAMLALRRARVLVYDEPSGEPSEEQR